MKKIILTCILMISVALSLKAQTRRVVVIRPRVARVVTVTPVPVIRPARVMKPVIVTRRIVAVRPVVLPARGVVVYR